ncbi:MAG TPA: zinc ribbon domain-containing protein [Pyrinomonadaceae bacterium]|nr:zinc ribbon domain-containing protein [Pyrinomonadaceae bacterium]
MFCPKCGQQQITDGVRFCPRCGFQLEALKELLATDGAAPLAWAVAETQMHRQRSARERGIRQGIMLMLLTAFIVPMTAILAKLGIMPKEFIALAAVFCAFGGFIRFIYALMIEEGVKTGKPAMPPAYNQAMMQSHLHATASPTALPPQQSIPASEFGKRRIETAEMVYPPSVTENTTRLLDNANEK